MKIKGFFAKFRIKIINEIFYYLIFLLILISCSKTDKNDKIKEVKLKNFTFVTWENPCFDRCASVWLIKKFVDSTATFTFIKFGVKVTQGIPFDVPGAELGRHRNISCFESIIQKYKISDSVALEISKIVHDIDVNKWGEKMTEEADSLESIFQEIRKSSKDDFECLSKTDVLFEHLYSYMKKKSKNHD